MNSPIKTSPLKALSAGVFGTDDRVVTANGDTVRQLIQEAKLQPLRRARLCAHPGPQDVLHEMLIVLARGTYVQPHRHPKKSESFHVIEGECDLVLFNEGGEISRVIELGRYETGKVFYYRLSECRYHTVLIKSEQFVVHETTNGPFQRGDAEFASWAPAPEDGDAVRAFMAALERRVDALSSE